MADKNISVRIPEDLHTRIKTASEQDRRSLNSEILWLIEQGLTKRDEE
jgi:hypothetical protein